MKQIHKTTLAIAAGIIFFITGTAFLVSKPSNAVNNVPGEFSFECNGKKYTANQELSGGVTIAPDKRAFFEMVGEHQTGKRAFRLQITLNLKEFKTDTYALTTMTNNLDNKQKDGFVLASLGTLADSTNTNEAPEVTPEDITGESETGTFTISSISENVAGHAITVSGKFEFAGPNDTEGAPKRFAVKGSFTNVKLGRFAAPSGGRN